MRHLMYANDSCTYDRVSLTTENIFFFLFCIITFVVYFRITLKPIKIQNYICDKYNTCINLK